MNPSGVVVKALTRLWRGVVQLAGYLGLIQGVSAPSAITIPISLVDTVDIPIEAAMQINVPISESVVTVPMSESVVIVPIEATMQINAPMEYEE